MTDARSTAPTEEADCLAVLDDGGGAVCGALLALSVLRLEQQRSDDAAALARAALAIRPGLAGAHRALGLAQAACGAMAMAADTLQHALLLDPLDLELRVKLTRTLLDLSRNDEALKVISSMTPDTRTPPDQRVLVLTQAHCVRGRALLALRQPMEALKAFDAGAHFQSASTEPWLGRGMALIALGRPAGALDPLRRAHEANPTDAEAAAEFGLALGKLGKYTEAIQWFEKALQINAKFAPAYRYMGSALSVLQLEKDALVCFREARRLRPEWDEVWLDEAGVLLRAGRLQQGWRAYERRESARYMTKISVPAYWTGDEDVAGKSILLAAEQGLGDTLHFVRYAPLIAALGARVILEVQRPLRPLLAPLAQEWGVTIIGQGEPRPMTDLQVLLLSVPYAYGTRLDTIPAPSPYLRTPPAHVETWRDAVPRSDRLRVGLVASGNPHYRDDAIRSIALSQMTPLLDVAGIAWYWLQPETRDDERDVLARFPEVEQIGVRFRDFADTAAVIDQLDLVVTVDTSVAHLAGALGKPVWILIPFQPDWRWMLEREDSPWYPTVRLFRQRRPGEWDQVVRNVADALTRRVAGTAGSVDA